MTEIAKKEIAQPTRPSAARRLLKWGGILLLVLVLLLLVLGLVPVSSSGLDSSAAPLASYEEAVNRFETIKQEEAAIVNDASGSLLFAHGEPTEKVYVMIHGTTNSPKQWEELGSALYERGHNVLILRMPHHGLESHDIGELKALRAEELRDYADGAMDMAAGLGDEITVVGISGGGAVATWIGQHRADAHRVLALSPFYAVPEIPGFLNTFLMNLASRAPNVNLQNPSEPQRDWVYRGEATRGVAEFMRLGKNVFRSAAETAPAANAFYFVTTAVDDTADNGYTAELARMWREDGADVSAFEFDASSDIPHNSVDPAADTAKKALVYDKILEMLGEEPLQ